jgi:hypothetical protein
MSLLQFGQRRQPANRIPHDAHEKGRGHHEQEEQLDDEQPEQPEPLGLEAPLNLYPTEKPHADIFFWRSLLPHLGQTGSSLLNTRSSKSSPHFPQLYS